MSDTATETPQEAAKQPLTAAQCKALSAQQFVDWILWSYNAKTKVRKELLLSVTPVGKMAKARNKYLTILAVHREVSRMNKHSATNPAPETGRMVYWFKHELPPEFAEVEAQNEKISAEAGVGHKTGEVGGE